jgi:hypothetical protein
MDEAFWMPYLTGMPDIIPIGAGENLRASLASLPSFGMAPALAVISSRLYPQQDPELVATIREFFPKTDFLMASSSAEHFPSMEQLIADNVRHVVIVPAGNEDRGRSPLAVAIRNLVARRFWTMTDYLSPGTSINEFAISSSDQKEELIALLSNQICGDSPESELLRQKGALLADEMLENALYGAPRSENGQKIFRKGEKRSLLSREKIVFRFGFDGKILALEVADGWGSLSPEIVMERMNRGETTDQGGGLGLFIIWRFFDQFHVNIRPGGETVVGGHIRLTSEIDPLVPKGFHITCGHS